MSLSRKHCRGINDEPKQQNDWVVLRLRTGLRIMDRPRKSRGVYGLNRIMIELYYKLRLLAL